MASSMSLAQAPSSKTPRLHLEADGHACAGYLRTTATRFIWKSAFSLCDTQYRVLDHNKKKGEWTLELYSNPASIRQSCTFQVISIRPFEPELSLTYPLWNVYAFENLDDFHADPPRSSFGCPMQSANPH
jgi:hypothetical protein